MTIRWLLVLALFFFWTGCASPDRRWTKRKSGPPKAWEQDITVALPGGALAVFRVAFGGMEEVEPGVYHIVEPGRKQFRIVDLPIFGVEIAPLSGIHRLRCEYDHPLVVDVDGTKRTHQELPGVAAVGPSTGNVTHYNALDFGIVDPRWRVPGVWKFSVYEGDTLITTVEFELRGD